jgi:predicted alpha-1,2-mannosidase
MFRFTFPQSSVAHIVMQAINVDDQPEPFFDAYWNSKASRLKLTSYIHIDTEKKEITGYNPDRGTMNLGPELKNFKGYFVIQFEKPFGAIGTWNNDTILPYSKELYAQKRLGAYVSFPARKDETVKVKIGTSFISIEQARENLEREMPDWDFEKVKQSTRDTWQQYLERFKIEGDSEEQKVNFYTSLYHCLIFPRMFSEYGKYYSAADDKIHEGVAYNDYSLWDTYRALHPFLIFAAPERVNDMITSMLNTYKEGGWLPMWPNPAETNVMTGTHADPVIADAYIKGFRGYDVNLAYEAMRKNAMMPGDKDLPVYKTYDCNWEGFEGRKGSAFYHSIGYLPVDYVTESVSRTLEFGLDDYCIAQVAKDMGKIDDYNRLISWSQNYKNVFNKETGLVAPRLFNGNWYSKTREGFTEGSPQIYAFAVAHDIPGLIDLIGGNEKFAARLNDFFAKGQYQHDNEPGHHIIYLYNYCGQPWKTQELVRKVITENYSNRPNGINGNDDCGQMSSWYMFGVMGFYPVTPATGIYALGAPQLPKITMNHLDANGKACSFEIVAHKLSGENKYVQKVTLDGKLLETPFISHDQIINGRKLEFEMGSKPNYNTFKNN